MAYDVFVYAQNADDYTGTGLCGAVPATECTHEEIAGGMSAVTLTCALDGDGRWKQVTRGRILSCMTRVRTCPEIEDGVRVTAVEIWKVKATASKAQRTLYSKKTGGKKKKVLKAGTRVVVVKKDAERYKIYTISQSSIASIAHFGNQPSGGGASGWIALDGIDFELEETVNEIEDVAPAWDLRRQQFRVQSVEVDTDRGTMTAYAPHVSYDLAINNTRYKNEEALTAQTALSGILDNCDFDHEFEAYTDIGDTRTACDWVNINPMQALLDPETGFCVRWGAELARDDTELYFLARAGRNRGTRIEYGKNLLGVNYQVSEEKVVTALLPIGRNKNGDALYLTDIEGDDGNYVMSAHADDYATTHALAMECDNCTVKTDGVTVELARARMREQAQARFDDDEIDLPDVSLKVNFLELGDTEEYAQYKGLEMVYLYDEVPVADPVHGIEASTNVKRIVLDCLTGRIREVELGDLAENAASVYSWQIPSLDGGKLKPGTVRPDAFADDSIPENKLDPDLQAALDRAYAEIDEAQALIEDTRSWLDTVEATSEAIQSAVTDNEGNISALLQTATAIRAALTDAENNLAAVQLTATQLRTALTDAEGNISTLSQTATSMSSTIQSMNGDISSVRQTANSLSSIVGNESSGLVSMVTQLSDRVAMKVRDNTINSSFEMVVGTDDIPLSSISAPGIQLNYNGVSLGGLYGYGSDMVLSAESRLQIWSSAGGIFFGAHETSGSYGMVCDLNILPRVGGACDIGGNGKGQRWRKIFASNALDTSDVRFKRDIAPLNAAWLLNKLQPIRFRFIESEEKNGKTRFGFAANTIDGNVQDAIRGTDIADANLLDDENPEHLNLAYKELIAVLVEGWQKHEAEIAELKRRVAESEERHGDNL